MADGMEKIAPCGECGSDKVTLRRGALSAQVTCRRCGARGSTATGSGAEALAFRSWETQKPTPAARAPRASAGPQGRVAKGDGRDPLELIARMLVGGSYRVPIEGRSTVAPLGSSDIAGAVAYMQDDLQRETALAVALRADSPQVARLSATAYRRIASHVRHLRPRPLDLRTPADRWRLRLVIFDAATELVWPERRRPSSEMAKEVRMRKSCYLRVQRLASSILQEALNEGRRSFKGRLFG